MRGPALLFCPGDRPERFGKASDRADSTIIDLEDAVAPERKEFARHALVESTLDPSTTIVRINPVGTRDFDADLAALASTTFTTIMLAKTQRGSDVDRLAGYDVIALCENAVGVENAGDIASAKAVVGLMWGAEDLVASLGGTSSRRPDGRYRDFARFARSRILIAAAAQSKFAIDAIHANIDDVDGLRAEAEDAAASGFTATACIHPNQVATIRKAYAPTEAEVTWARRVLHAAATEGGAFRFEGAMVDEPILRQATRTVEYGERR